MSPVMLARIHCAIDYLGFAEMSSQHRGQTWRDVRAESDADADVLTYPRC